MECSHPQWLANTDASQSPSWNGKTQAAISTFPMGGNG